jgi:hypothetical protein
LDSASISGTESRSLIISEPAFLADEMSGTKENTLPACVAPKTVLCKENDEQTPKIKIKIIYHQNDEELESGSFKT